MKIENVKVYDLEECIKASKYPMAINTDINNYNLEKSDYYGFIYITTNNINGRKYIGQRKYYGKWQIYLGSGSILKDAIKKYGVDNFSMKIIDECYSKDELNKKEQYWIDYYNAIDDRLFYNIAKGGSGGDTYSGLTEENLNTVKQKLNHEGERNPMFNKKHNNKTKEKISIKAKERLKTKENNPNFGKTGTLNNMSIKIKCIETDEVFCGIREAGRLLNIPFPNIIKSLKSNGKYSAGKINNKRLHWIYFEGK